MKAPVRFLDQPRSELGTELLRSALGEGPSPEARRKAIAAVGLAAGIAAGAQAAHLATGLLGAKAAWTSPLILAAKWTVIGMAGGAVFVGAAVVAQSTRAPQEPEALISVVQAPSAVTGLSSTIPYSKPSGEPPRTAEATSALSPPTPTITLPKTALAPSTPLPATSAQNSPLAEELELIDDARSALASRDGQGALRALNRHAAKFPRGSFNLEAWVLRVEALSLVGDRAQANALGSAFLKAHPTSPLGRRVRALLGLREAAPSNP